MHTLTADPTAEVITYRDALSLSMRDVLRRHPEVIVIGQGVTDHKGTFGTLLGLAETFGADRVLEMPIAEDATTGLAIGAALNGLYPIQIHIRVDFALLAMNQLVNLAAKYRYMFGGRFEVPMLVRAVIGRSWGQGAQHSQSLQSLFAHIPGLTVVMPSSADSVLETYAYAVATHKGPVISLEHRLLYDVRFNRAADAAAAGQDSRHVRNRLGEGGSGPASVASPLTSRRVRNGSDVTIVATSIMVVEALRAARYLSERAGIECDVIDLHAPSHPDWDLIVGSVARTGRLVVADTGWPAYGVCAEVCRIIAERNPAALKAPVVSIALPMVPCPTAKALEDLFYPTLADVVHRVAALVTGRADHGVPPPQDEPLLGAGFKGPF
jgi:acetoin:2,6-dichlorophenolindophenol oxidoreductase subunit beta